MPRTRTRVTIFVIAVTALGIGCDTAETTRRVERIEERLDDLHRIGSAQMKIERVALSLSLIDDEVATLKESRNDTTMIGAITDLIDIVSSACATAKDAATEIQTELAALETEVKRVESDLDALEDTEDAADAYEDLAAMLDVIEEKLASIDDEVERLKEASGDTSTVYFPGGCDGLSSQITAIQSTIAALDSSIAAARERIASGS